MGTSDGYTDLKQHKKWNGNMQRRIIARLPLQLKLIFPKLRTLYDLERITLDDTIPGTAVSIRLQGAKEFFFDTRHSGVNFT